MFIKSSKLFRFGFSAIVLLTFVGILASCNHSDSTTTVSINTTSNSDSSNSDSTLHKCSPKADHRVVSVSPTATEMVYAIGAGDRLVAADEFSTYPKEAPSIAGLSGFTPNIEAILNYEPSLVLTSSSREEDEFSKLADFDICVVRQDAAKNLEGVYSQLTDLGEILKQEDAAKELISSLRSRVAEAIDGANSNPRRTYFYELDNTFYTVTDNTFIGHILGLLNLQSIAPTGDSDFPQLNPEAILTSNPNVILLADTKCCAQSRKTVSERPGWGNLTAVKQGRILELDDDIASRWGPRIVGLLESVSSFLSDN